MKKTLLVILTLILSNISCELLQIKSEDITALLPWETDVPGWKIKSPAVKYTEKNIGEYSQGDVNLFKLYGLNELAVCTYYSISNAEKEITVSILRMNSPLNSFGILSMERSDSVSAAEVCDDSYTNEKGLFYRKGKFYVKINRAGEISIDDLNTFGKTVCVKLCNEADKLPDYISLFNSDTSRINLVYHINDIDDIPGIKNIYVLKTTILDKPVSVFFTKRDSGYDTIGEFSRLLKETKDPFILSSAEKSQIAFKKKGDSDFIFISVYKEWIYGVLSTDSMVNGKRIINYLYEGILEFEKKKK